METATTIERSSDHLFFARLYGREVEIIAFEGDKIGYAPIENAIGIDGKRDARFLCFGEAQARRYIPAAGGAIHD